MKPSEALNLLIQASSLAPMPKQSHINVEQAAATLQEFIQQKKEAPPAEGKVAAPRAVKEKADGRPKEPARNNA